MGQHHSNQSLTHILYISPPINNMGHILRKMYSIRGVTVTLGVCEELWNWINLIQGCFVDQPNILCNMKFPPEQ